MNGKLIVLNGLSSSGKTTISGYLKKILPFNHLAIGTDIFMHSMASGFAIIDPGTKSVEGHKYGLKFMYDDEGKLISIDLSNFGYQYISTVYKSIAVFLEAGFNVVYDDMIFNDRLYSVFKGSFCNYDHQMIKVYCSEDERKTREEKRGDRIFGTYMIGSEYVDSCITHDYEFNSEYGNVDELAEYITSKVRQT